ncbi:MAG: pyrimidine dimer DNA glycosylase/endonuclease V [Candidatus Bathyarchaeia archaeon]
MRLWSLHPKYLDRIGLVALWREGLLAKKVLEGKTKGYRTHPELTRFRRYEDSIALINSYLYEVYLEATRRGYAFNRSKITPLKLIGVVTVTRGQLANEFTHLLGKLERRDPVKFEEVSRMHVWSLEANPIFKVLERDVEE